MRIDTIHEFIGDLLHQEQKGYQSPRQIDLALDRGQWRVFNYYLPIYAINREAKEALTPFVKKLTYQTDNQGLYAIPSGESFESLLGMGIQFSEGGVPRFREVSFPGEDEINSRLNSQLLAPTLTEPIGETTGLGSFQLYPAAIYAGTIRFICKPKAPKYAYTRTGRTLNYDHQNSQQLEWAEKYQDKVILAALTYLGLNLGDEGVLQVSEALSKLK